MIPTLNSMVKDIPEAASIHINQIVYDKKNRGERVYTFSLGEAFFDIPRFEISDEMFMKGCHYSSSMGQPALRACLSDYYYNRYGAKVDPDTEILVSAGSKPIIFMLLMTVLNPGDEVVVREPAWLSYKEQIRLAGGRCVAVPYYVSVEELEQYITDATKVIVINNPNNPSGYLYTREELEYLYGIAEKHNLFVLSDEAYSDFLTGEDKFLSFANIDTKKEHCLVVNSLSKNMGFSGWRVGYAIAHRSVVSQLLKVNQHLITCAPTLLQDYLAEHFREILRITLPQANELAVKRKKVQEFLEQIGIDYLKGVGTFYFMLDVSAFAGTTEELVYELLLNHNIATVFGEAYGESTKDFIRFGIGTESIQDIENSLRTIKMLLEAPDYDASGIRGVLEQYR